MRHISRVKDHKGLQKMVQDSREVEGVPGLVVPYVTETGPRGERAMDSNSRLLKDRIIFLGTPLDDQVANVVMAQLLHLDSEDPEQDINFYINSPGCSIPAMLAIYEAMRFVSAHVATTAMGSAFSAGAFLLAVGEKGQRSALPNTRILLHQPAIQGGPGGQASDIEIHAIELVHTKRRVNEILTEATGQPFEKIERDTDRDHIMSAKEAVEYGVIDRVVSRPLEMTATRSAPKGRSRWSSSNPSSQASAWCSRHPPCSRRSSRLRTATSAEQVHPH
jgi:ATP-dependent Clp protease protease subunit